MSFLRNTTAGLRSLFRKEQVDRDLDEELRAYQDMATDEKIKQRMSRKDALREVRLERGSVDAAKEVVRSGGRATGDLTNRRAGSDPSGDVFSLSEREC